MKRIGLFGGTFDPPHRAHAEIAKLAYEQLELDQVIFIPCQRSPHKETSQPLAAAERLKLISIAIHDATWASISDVELQREGLSYSIDTVEYFRGKYAEAKLYWIMGSDQWEVFDTWHRSDDLAELLEFIVFPRPEIPQPKPGKKLHVIEHTFDISSSKIRTLLSQGKPVGDTLQPEVVDYIRAKELYGN